MPRFVILLHKLPPGADRPTHWDLMLESEGALRTWALANEPRPNQDIAAEQLADHRLDYLTYEGEVSGDRGRVIRWDEGEYDAVAESDGWLQVLLSGSRLRGIARLVEGDPGYWTFSLMPVS
jgi:hypothetical protein